MFRFRSGLTFKVQSYGWMVIFSGSLVGGWAGPGWAEAPRLSSTQLPAKTAEVQTQMRPPILPINQRDRPALTVKEWRVQIETSTVQVTGVSLKPSETGLEIILRTAEGKPLQVDTSRFRAEGTSLVADLPNAVLTLLDGQEFTANNPIADISSVRITQLNINTIRVSVTGSNALPQSAVTLRIGELVYSLTPAAGQQTGESEVEIVVTAAREDGYNPTNSSTATGTDTPIRDIPFSIQVVPEQVIEDRQATELGEALETVGGVSSSGGRGTSVFGPNFLIRGFDVSDSIFRDRIPYFSLSPLSTTDIERVEVLKGPASILFGQGEPGGIINLVSKVPLASPFYSASFSAGNYNDYQGSLDFSGPLNASKTLRYRLNFSYQDYGSFRDFVDGEQLLISPVLAWDITPNTSLTFYGQFTRNRETLDEGIVAIGDRPAKIPRDRFLGESFAEFEQNQFNLGYRFNHRFSDDLMIRHVLQYTQYQPRRYAPLFDSLNEETGELSRFEYFAGGTYKRLFTNAEVVGKFKTGFVKHQVLFGTEYRNYSENPRFQFSQTYPSINIFDPIYTGKPFKIRPEFFRDDTVNTYALYLQDQIDLLPNLKLLAGFRYEYVDQFRTTRDLGSPKNEFELSDTAFTPRFGIVYQPIEPISLYASYTTSFNPAFGASRNADGSVFEPETGRQYEVGIKADLTERLSLTVAAFDIRKQNVETPDPENPIFSLQTGEVTSRGFEFNLGGEILPGWNLIAAYTYLDTFVSEDNTNIVGNRLPNVPENQFSLWSTYRIQRGQLKGLGFGLGFFYVDNREGDLENTFILPSYFRTDAALYYQRNNWRAQLNIENLFDIQYFSAATFGSRLGINPGAPFSIKGTISVDF